MQTYAIPTTEVLKVSGSFQVIAEYNGLFYVIGENLNAPFFQAQLPQEVQELREQELQKARELKIQELNAHCDSLLQSFTSSALGSEYIYDATLEDQVNLLGLVVANTDGYFRCFKENEIKQNIPHNKEQLKQVFHDGVQHKAQTIAICGILKAHLQTLTKTEDIQNLKWEDYEAIQSNSVNEEA